MLTTQILRLKTNKDGFYFLRYVSREEVIYNQGTGEQWLLSLANILETFLPLCNYSNPL